MNRTLRPMHPSLIHKSLAMALLIVFNLGILTV